MVRCGNSECASRKVSCTRSFFFSSLSFPSLGSSAGPVPALVSTTICFSSEVTVTHSKSLGESRTSFSSRLASTSYRRFNRRSSTRPPPRFHTYRRKSCRYQSFSFTTFPLGTSSTTACTNRSACVGGQSGERLKSFLGLNVSKTWCESRKSRDTFDPPDCRAPAESPAYPNGSKLILLEGFGTPFSSPEAVFPASRRENTSLSVRITIERRLRAAIKDRVCRTPAPIFNCFATTRSTMLKSTNSPCWPDSLVHLSTAPTRKRLRCTLWRLLTSGACLVVILRMPTTPPNPSPDPNTLPFNPLPPPPSANCSKPPADLGTL